MKNLFLLLILMPLLFTTGCKSEKAKNRAASVASFAVTPLANTVLSCKTGLYTSSHLKNVFYDIFDKDEKKLDEAIAKKRKGIIGKAACIYATNLLFSAADMLGDSLLSEEMISDECSTKEMSTKGRAWVLSKCTN